MAIAKVEIPSRNSNERENDVVSKTSEGKEQEQEDEILRFFGNAKWVFSVVNKK